jgi:hypothetical protein
MPKRFATCHPDKWHRANGLCDVCYRRQKQNRQYYRKKGTTRNPMYGKRMAVCHPDRKYHSKGLCVSCCNVQWFNKKIKVDSQFHEEKKKKLRELYHAENSPQRDNYYLRNYGITIKDYEEINKLQGYTCKICKKRDQKQRLAVDHNHKTGTVRGLLCNYCNQITGVLENRGEGYFMRLIEYVRSYNIEVKPETLRIS